MTYAMLLAGGIGSRLTGYDTPKQFIHMDNQPIIIHTIRKFLTSKNVDKIIVCCIKSHKETLREMISYYLKDNLNDIYVTIGGKNRSESILEGCLFIKNSFNLDDNDIVLTHDGVRPFVTSRIINENINVILTDPECNGVNTVVSAIDTIVVSSDGNEVFDIPKREEMYMTQTPQTFRINELLQAYEELDESEFEKVTDACQVILKQNKKIRLVKGEYFNIKITNNDDLDHAKVIFAKHG